MNVDSPIPRINRSARTGLAFGLASLLLAFLLPMSPTIILLVECLVVLLGLAFSIRGLIFASRNAACERRIARWALMLTITGVAAFVMHMLLLAASASAMSFVR